MVSITALLIGLLLPALKSARSLAKVTSDLSNLRQVGIGMAAYNGDHNGYYPKHSSSKTGPWPGFNNRPRWPDFIYAYLNEPGVFLNPLLSQRELETNFQKPFAHDTSFGYGGYGYNFQYLGSSRFSPSFHANHAIDIMGPSDTVIVGDTAGSRGGNAGNEPGDGAEAVYVLDPPLASIRRAHPDGRAYYPSGSVEEPTGTPDTYLWRSFPAERGGMAPSFSLADGHAKQVPITVIDDHNRDGLNDNGFWNGKSKAAVR